MLNKPSKDATYGEKLFYNRLNYIFSQRNDIICYVQPNLPSDRKPDYLLLSPNFGIIIVEIKDYKPEFLKECPKVGEWESLWNEEPKSRRNPFDQIYHYRDEITFRIGKCKFPKEVEAQIQPIQLVCFSQISKEDFIVEQIKKNVLKKFIFASRKYLAEIRISRPFSKILLL